MKTIWYSIPEYDNVKYFVKVDVRYDINKYQHALIELCAENYFYRTEMIGTSNWPLVFALFEDEYGPEIVRYEVDLEQAPVFHSRKVEEQSCQK